VQDNYQVMPPLTAEEYNELKSDIAQRGVMVPIEYDEHGNVLDGHHRLQICVELGIRDFPKVIRAGMTEVEKRTHARKLNMARRQLTATQKRQAIQDQLQETPEMSDRQIAQAIGVANSTVTRNREKMVESGQLLQCNSSVGADGKVRPRQVERKPIVVEEPDEEWDEEIEPTDDDVKAALYDLDELMVEHPVLTELVQDRPTLNELISSYDGKGTFYEHAKSAVEEQPEIHRPHVSNNSGNNEWYTPKKYVDAARNVLGHIDLDPASCDYANKTIQAEHFYSVEDDGLTKEWCGKVWMNPPYNAEGVTRFTEKFVDEYNAGNIKEGIVLVNNATETSWFVNMVSAASAVVFPRGRIRYESATRESLAPLQGQAFLYFGKNTEKFFECFSDIGWGAVIR